MGLQPIGNSDSFFCPEDAEITLDSQNQGMLFVPRNPETLLSVTDLLKTINASQMGQSLILIDACREAAIGKWQTEKGIVSLPPVKLQSSVLLACLPGQRAFEDQRFGGGHGAFFLKVLEGLAGGGGRRTGAGCVG